MPAGRTKKPPRWNLATIYGGFDSEDYRSDKNKLSRSIAKLSRTAAAATSSDSSEAKSSSRRSGRTGNSLSSDRAAATWLTDCIRQYNLCDDLARNLMSFAYTQYSVNTQDKVALRELNALQEIIVPLHKASVEFRNALAQIGSRVGPLADANPQIGDYRHFLDEELRLQKLQMSAELEELSADLSRSGGDAWSRLQEAISSQLSMVWNEKTGERKTVVDLRSMAMNPDRSVREKAFRLELAAWKSMETPIAYALNGVKGFSVSLNGRRGYRSTLDRSVLQSRLTRKSIEALIGTMEASLPVFHDYLRAKAKLIGVNKLAFFDLFAPVGKTDTAWSFTDARRFIVDQFNSFSADLGAFAEHAFRNNWIDAEPRAGKVGGAYCTDFPLAKASRVMSNFDGTFSGVTTLAHELGHAYHHEVLKNATAIHRSYPMTLAETASIFCETIVFNSAYRSAPDREKIGILETFLQDATQVIVDILSRYKFEMAVFERRKTQELAPDEFSDLMIQAQKETYGPGLDPKNLHPYMWAVKGHYYSQDLAYYNFPYAFGQLFGLGLYNLYQKEPKGFPERYRKLLATTGRASARDVTLQAGFDIEKADSWQEGIAVIQARVKEFKTLAGTLTAARSKKAVTRKK